MIIKATAPHISPAAARGDQNRAEVNTTTADPIPSNDKKKIGFTLFGDQSDLRAYKSKSPTPVAVGSEANSSIYIHNYGPRPATPVQIVDVLDENESYVGYSGIDWNCSYDATPHAVICDYNTSVTPLAFDADTKKLYIITKAEKQDDNLSNTVCTGGSGGSDEPLAIDNNTSNDCVTVGILATGTTQDKNITDIEVHKTTSDTHIDTTENNFTYTMIVKNIGKDTAKEVEFKDIIPMYIGQYNGRPATGLKATTNKNGTSCSISGGQVVCDLKDMDVNDTVEINITVTRPMKEGDHNNTAMAYSKLTGDTNRTNNQDSVMVAVVDVADIELVEKLVTYTGHPDPILAGTEAIYTIQVRNNGPSTAKDVNMSDVFDGEEFTFISVDNGCTYDSQNRTVNCALGDIGFTEVKTITVVVQPDHNATVSGAWEINNTATVTTATPESNTTNNDKNQTLKVRKGEVDVSIEINEAPGFTEPVPYNPDNNDSNVIIYEVAVQNLGPSLATDINFSVFVNNVFPDANQTLEYLRDTSHADGSPDDNNICVETNPNPFEVNASAPKMYCSVGELNASASNKIIEYKRYIVYHINNAPNFVSGDVYKVDTNVTAAETETNYANNTENENTTVRITTDPQIIKTASVTDVEIGQDFNYTLNIINNGPGYSPNTIVRDTLPAGMILTAKPTATQGTCTGMAGGKSFECNVDEADYTLHSKYNDTNAVNEVNISVPVKFVSYVGGANEYNAINTATVSTTGPDTNKTNNESNSTVTVHKPAKIGDRVWLDRNADGIQSQNSSDNEIGIKGVTVYLLDINNSVVQTTITDGAGNYSFDINHSADYSVEFNLTHIDGKDYNSTNLFVTDQNIGSDNDKDSDINASGTTEVFKVNYGDNNMTIDAGLYTYIGIGDRVWVDENGDANQTLGEDHNISDVNVTLWYKNYGGTTYTRVTQDIHGDEIGDNGIVTTDANGSYLFDMLKPGRYYVEFNKSTLPSEYVFTEKNAYTNVNPFNITDSDPDRDTGKTASRLVRTGSKISYHYIYKHLDAGIYIPVSIGDHVWHDHKGDGIQDTDEKNISDVNVTLWYEHNNTQVTHDQNGTEIGVGGIVTTDSNGTYLFENLVPGKYYVKFQTPVGYVPTVQDSVGSSDNNDSDLNATTLRTIVYELTSDEDNRSVDAGYFVEVKLGDRVWYDKNYNGIQDINETNVTGVTVELYMDGNATGKEQNTTATGYLFEHLAPNHTYGVKFSNLPADYRFTKPDASGSDDTNDSDANITTGRTTEQTGLVVSHDVNLSFDAGIYKPVTIGNYVWEDMNADGIQNDGDHSGLNGVLATLIIDGVLHPEINATTATSFGESGYYFFGTSYDLKPDSNYSVQFSHLPASARPYIVTAQNAISTNDRKRLRYKRPKYHRPNTYYVVR